MSEHTVKAFGEQLEALSSGIAQMGGLAEAQLADAVDAIARRDTGLGRTRDRRRSADRHSCSRQSKSRR